jgi:hypothetical protein
MIREKAGYCHPHYAWSFGEFGRPRELRRCGGWILERLIPGHSCSDAMGCYPLFVCRDWVGLKDDLDEIGDDLVSLSLVADPFGNYAVEDLDACFDLVRPFKKHVVIDLTRARDEIVSKHHRERARRALNRLKVERCESPHRHLDEWIELHRCLVARFGICGIRAFSREAFSLQFDVPGASLFRAISIAEGRTVGAALRFQSGDVVYGHVMALNEEGYRLGASYALTWFQLDYYSGRARWLNLQGVPGADDSGSEGLRQYKLGWSPQTKTAYLCGRIFNREMYEEIVEAKGAAVGNYFPAYRNGELT